MKAWTYILFFLYVIFHKFLANFREARVRKIYDCIDSAQFSASQDFISVRSTSECAHLYLASDAVWMLVRFTVDGAVLCGHTTTPPRPVSCGNRIVNDVAVYVDPHREPTYNISCVGLYQLRGTIYCVHKDSTTRSKNDVETYCASVGGMTLEVETKEDILLLLSFPIGGQFWIGADDLQKQGEYRWNSGAVVNPSLFTPGEPNVANERCVVIGYGNHKGLTDLPCHEVKLTVCAVPSH